MVAQEFPAQERRPLRIATGAIQLGDGSALSAQGLKPDIAVEVSPEDERAYYADAFKVTEQDEPADKRRPVRPPARGAGRTA